MFTRRPALTVVLVVYLGSIALLCLTPNGLVVRVTLLVRRALPDVSAAAIELAMGTVLFVPVGMLLVMVLGRHRWIGIILVGVIASCWIQLAQMALLPEERLESRTAMAHMIGCTMGVLAALALLSVRRHARESHATHALTSISQSNASRL